MIQQVWSGDRQLFETCWIANHFVTRLLGLMGRTEILDSQAMYFPRCNSIHTFFMRFPLDIAFLSGDGRVVSVNECVRPWRVVGHLKARHVLEARAGVLRKIGIEVGNIIEFRESA